MLLAGTVPLSLPSAVHSPSRFHLFFVATKGSLDKHIALLTASGETAIHETALIGKMHTPLPRLVDAGPRPCVATVIADTRNWIETAVIGLNLCPFAKVIYVADRIRYCVSEAESGDALLVDLSRELRALQATAAQVCETTLLIHPNALNDFLDYNDFLGEAEAMVEALGLTGTLQLASFHPRYQFAGSGADDIENYTNRSPYPMLHLLRESSVERVVRVGEEVAAIGERNMKTLRRLGIAGWRRLWQTKSGSG